LKDNAMARPASDLARRAQSGTSPGGLRRAVPPLTVRSRLDLATVFGLFGGLCLVAVGIGLGGEFKAFVDLPAILIVFGGTIAATTICFSIREVVGTQRVIVKTFLRRVADPELAALQLIQLSVRARTAGALSLENELGRVRGGACKLQQKKRAFTLASDTFEHNICQHSAEKRAIARHAAAMCATSA
jgi:flagellar motor component MotA